MSLRPEDRKKIFEEIYINYAERLRRVVASKLYNGKASADSVVHSVLLSQMEKGHAPDDDRDLWLLLRKASLRHCQKHNKRTIRAKGAARPVGAVPSSTLIAESSTDKSEDRAYDVADASLDPARSIEAEDWLEYVLSRLTLTQRDILGLKLSGRTIAEIADEIGITEKSVTSMLRLIRDRVRDCFFEDFDEE